MPANLMPDTAAFIIFGCLYPVLLALHVRSSWRMYRGFGGATRTFQFYVLDLVAASVGFAPTVWLASRAMQGSALTPLDAWLLAAAAGVSQAVGAFVGRIHGTVPPQEPPSEWIDALWVFGGALYGLLLLAGSFVAFAMAYTIVLFMFKSGPMYIMVLVGFVMLAGYAIYLHF